MKRFVQLVAFFAVAGAVAAWCYTWLRKPLFYSEAVIAVGEGLSYEETAREGRRLRESAVMNKALRLSGGGASPSPEVEVVEAGKLRLGSVRNDSKSAEAFVRAWVESYREDFAARRSEADREEADNLRAMLTEEEKSFRGSKDDLRGFFTEKMGMSAGQAEAAFPRLESGEGIREILGEDRGRIEREIREAEKRLEGLASKEEGLTKALSEEEKYIVTYQVKEKNPVVDNLKQQLTEKQVELQRLLIDSSEKHPLVQRLKGEIEKTKSLIESKESNSIKEERIEFNPVYKDIALDLSRVKRERAALETYLARMKKSLSAETERLEKLAAEADRSDSLIGEYRARSGKIRDIRARIEEREGRRALSRRAGVEVVTFLSPARPRSSTGWGALIAGGAFAGALVGALSWAALPFLRRTFSSTIQ